MTDSILVNKPKKLYIIEKDKNLITFLKKQEILVRIPKISIIFIYY